MENINCLQCKFRHPDNGNCMEVGGFCTAVPAAYCPLLRQYLGTGLTPEQAANAKTIIESAFAEDTSKAERIRKLLAADKEDRCIILPCRVGDKIYYLKKKNIIEAKVIDYTVNEAGAWLFTVEIYDPKYDMTFQCDLETELIGKTVFFKREEAEKALQEMEGRKDG